MSWTLNAAGRIEAGLEHLEEELHAELHKVLSDKRYGLLFSHLQGAVVDKLHTVGQAPPAEPETSAQPAPALAAEAPEAAPAADPAPASTDAKASKASAKTTAG